MARVGSEQEAGERMVGASVDPVALPGREEIERESVCVCVCVVDGYNRGISPSLSSQKTQKTQHVLSLASCRGTS